MFGSGGGRVFLYRFSGRNDADQNRIGICHITDDWVETADNYLSFAFPFCRNRMVS